MKRALPTLMRRVPIVGSATFAVLLAYGCGFDGRTGSSATTRPLRAATFYRDEASARVQALAREISGSEPMESETVGPMPCSGAGRSGQEFYEVNWSTPSDVSKLDGFADELEAALPGYERHKTPGTDLPGWIFANGAEEIVVEFYSSSGLMVFGAEATCGAAE